MIGPQPKFFDSPFFVMEEDNWHLLPGAPKEVIDEFKEYMQDDELTEPKEITRTTISSSQSVRIS